MTLILGSGPAGVRADAGWARYVDVARTHVVLAAWDATRFHVRETAPDARDPGEALVETTPLEHAWEPAILRWRLECRLSLMGAYWMHDATTRGWRGLLRPQGARGVDLRPSEVVRPSEGTFHHFHDGGTDADRVLAVLPSPGPPGRHVLVSARVHLPEVEAGDLTLLHERLPAGPARSLVLRDLQALTERGFRKLVTREDYVRALGEGGDRVAGEALREIGERARSGDLKRARRLRQVTDETLTRVLALLDDPKLVSLHDRYLRPYEEEEALFGGVAAIRRLVAEKRGRVGHEEQHLLTLLEASLVARERMREGGLTTLDPVVGTLDRLSFYLR